MKFIQYTHLFEISVILSFATIATLAIKAIEMLQTYLNL
jgi:hypothetical protein